MPSTASPIRFRLREYLAPRPRVFAAGRYHVRCASAAAAAQLRATLPGVAFETARTADCLIGLLRPEEAAHCATVADVTALCAPAW